jgi:hypothetical protein
MLIMKWLYGSCWAYNGACNIYKILVWICVTQVDTRLSSSPEQHNDFQTHSHTLVNMLAFRFHITYCNASSDIIPPIYLCCYFSYYIYAKSNLRWKSCHFQGSATVQSFSILHFVSQMLTQLLYCWLLKTGNWKYQDWLASETKFCIKCWSPDRMGGLRCTEQGDIVTVKRRKG